MGGRIWGKNREKHVDVFSTSYRGKEKRGKVIGLSHKLEDGAVAENLLGVSKWGDRTGDGSALKEKNEEGRLLNNKSGRFVKS